MLDRCRVARFAKYAGKSVEAQLAPQLIESPNIPECQCRLELHLRRRTGPDALAAGGPQKTVQQGIDRPAGFIKPADRGNRALTRFTCFITERLDQLRVAVAAGTGELDEHD